MLSGDTLPVRTTEGRAGQGEELTAIDLPLSSQPILREALEPGQPFRVLQTKARG